MKKWWKPLKIQEKLLSFVFFHNYLCLCGIPQKMIDTKSLQNQFLYFDTEKILTAPLNILLGETKLEISLLSLFPLLYIPFPMWKNKGKDLSPRRSTWFMLLHAFCFALNKVWDFSHYIKVASFTKPHSKLYWAVHCM